MLSFANFVLAEVSSRTQLVDPQRFTDRTCGVSLLCHVGKFQSTQGLWPNPTREVLHFEDPATPGEQQHRVQAVELIECHESGIPREKHSCTKVPHLTSLFQQQIHLAGLAGPHISLLHLPSEVAQRYYHHLSPGKQTSWKSFASARKSSTSERFPVPVLITKWQSPCSPKQGSSYVVTIATILYFAPL